MITIPNSTTTYEIVGNYSDDISVKAVHTAQGTLFLGKTKILLLENMEEDGAQGYMTRECRLEIQLGLQLLNG